MFQKSMGYTNSNSKRQVFSNIGLSQETNKNKQPNFIAKGNRKRTKLKIIKRGKNQNRRNENKNKTQHNSKDQ